MTNDNETVEQVCECVEYLAGTDGGGLEIFGEHINSISLACRILSAHKREMDGLRALVKELADALDEDNKTECEQWCKCSCEHGDDKNGCETMCKKRALVARAREVTK